MRTHTHDLVAAGHPLRLNLASDVPSAAGSGEVLVCEWTIANSGISTVAASFYLRTTPIPLAALRCTQARTQQGRYHGSATLLIATNQQITLRALLGPLPAGEHELRVALVTEHETLEEAYSLVALSAGIT